MLKAHSRPNAREIIQQILNSAFILSTTTVYERTIMNNPLNQRLEALRDYLSTVPAGEVDQTYRPSIINLLTECWEGLVPSTNQQTTFARRKRFREALKKLMLEHGWSPEAKGNRVGFKRMPQLAGIADTSRRSACIESQGETHGTAADA